ncbi:uncharacterized protein LOC144665747 [Oculina patagonica]
MESNSRKNKRGARGSMEEETNVAKRSNMADSCDEEPELDASSSEPTPEPSLTDIKEMLVDIKTTVTAILKENQQFKEEIKELRAALNTNKRETEKLKTQLTKAEKANGTLQNELEQTRHKLYKQIEETDRLDEIYDELEQYSRKNSLEIVGVPESAYTSTEEVVIRIGEAVNITINPEDIEISHKLRRKNSRPIIVRFLSHKVKSRLYKARTKLKGLKVSDIFPDYRNASFQEQRIFINENLTDFRRELFWKANKKKKDNMIISAWTIDGKLFVKTSPDGAPIRIYGEEDLEDL